MAVRYLTLPPCCLYFLMGMELGEPDASGRRRPVEVPGSEFTMDVDTVIMSLGTSPNPLISSTVLAASIATLPPPTTATFFPLMIGVSQSAPCQRGRDYLRFID